MLQGLQAVALGGDPVPQPPQHLLFGAQHRFFVIDQENPFVSLGQTGHPQGVCFPWVLFGDREKHLYFRSNIFQSFADSMALLPRFTRHSHTVFLWAGWCHHNMEEVP